MPLRVGEQDMLEAGMRDLRAGVEEIADLGIIHTGSVGLQQCAVSLRMERSNGLFQICIETELGDEPAFRRNRVVRWPYSRRDRRDIAKALVDLHVVRGGPRPGVFVDDRTSAGKLLDSFTRRTVHGTYQFRSLVE